jgi:hypothetical protein
VLKSSKKNILLPSILPTRAAASPIMGRLKNGAHEQDEQEVGEGRNQRRTILRHLIAPLAVLQVRRHLAEIAATKGKVAAAVLEVIHNLLR